MTSELVLYCEIDIICIIFMTIMICNLWKSRKVSDGDRSFFFGALTIALVSLTDMVNAIFIGYPGKAIHYLLWVDNALYFILSVVAVYAMWVYVDYTITEDRAAVEGRVIMYSLPAVAAGILILASFYGGYVFYIDGMNVYHRGSLHVFQQAVCVLYFVMALTYSVLAYFFGKNVIKRSLYKTLMQFCFLPFIGLMCQIFVQGCVVVWPMACVGLFLMFTTHQNSQILTDTLTGLNNRTRLMRYISEQCYKLSDGNTMTCTIFDIDNLRNINSRYGHVAGDLAIVAIANIIKQTVATVEGSQFVARYTGDCFVVVSIGRKNVVNDLMTSFRQALDKVLSSGETKHHISVNLGSVTFVKFEESAEDFIKSIEDEMYKNRAENQAHKLNVEDVIE